MCDFLVSNAIYILYQTAKAHFKLLTFFSYFVYTLKLKSVIHFDKRKYLASYAVRFSFYKVKILMQHFADYEKLYVRISQPN